MCKIHRIHCSPDTLKVNINSIITEFIVIFKKIGKCYCMRFFFVGYIVIRILEILVDSLSYFKEKKTMGKF